MYAVPPLLEISKFDASQPLISMSSTFQGTFRLISTLHDAHTL